MPQQQPEKQKSIPEWVEIEDLVRQYKHSKEQGNRADTAVIALIERFYPLFKKYLIMIKGGSINFQDRETRKFIKCFMIEPVLKSMLANNTVTQVARNAIYQRFNFVRESYGALPEDEILHDLKYLLMIMLDRYQIMGRSFCAYVKGSYCYEVFRHIKRFIKDPTNIHYKNIEYEDYMIDKEAIDYLAAPESHFFENSEMLPDISWVIGQTCSDEFSGLTNLQRRILIKFYLEKISDKNIAAGFGMLASQITAIRTDTINEIKSKLISKL